MRPRGLVECRFFTFQSGLLEDLHSVELAGVASANLAHQEDLPEGSLSEHLEQFEVTGAGLLSLVPVVLDLELREGFVRISVFRVGRRVREVCLRLTVAQAETGQLRGCAVDG